jgi:hypothetical protein
VGQSGQTGQFGLVGQSGQTGQFGLVGQSGQSGQFGLVGHTDWVGEADQTAPPAVPGGGWHGPDSAGTSGHRQVPGGARGHGHGGGAAATGGRFARMGLGRMRGARGGSRQGPRVSAHAVKATGPLVAALVFTATAVDTTDPGFLTFPAYLVDRGTTGGGPPGMRAIATSGATHAATSAARRVLGAVFGEHAVDALAIQARADLLARVSNLLAEESQRYAAALAAARVDESIGERLREAGREVTIARMRAGLPAARTAPVRLPAPRPAPPSPGARPVAGSHRQFPGATS